jgi:hypothetical protein
LSPDGPAWFSFLFSFSVGFCAAPPAEASSAADATNVLRGIPMFVNRAIVSSF